MKDKFGTFRGKCLEGCACIEFKANPDGSSVRCSGCNHAPIKHESFGIVGSCRGCTECKIFEASYGEFEFCEYCECALQQHCIKPKPTAIVQVSEGVQKDVVSISPIYTQQQQQQQQHMPLQTGATDTRHQFGATPQTQPINPFIHSSIDASISQTAQIPVNQTAQIPVNQTAQIPVNQTGQIPVNQTAQIPVNQTAQIPVNQTGQIPVNQMGQLQVNQTAQIPVNQTGQIPVNQMGQLQVNQTGQVPMNQTGQVPMNQTAQVPMNQMGQVPMNQMGQVPVNQTGQVPVNQTGQVPMNQTAQVPVNQTGQVPVNQMGQLQVNQMGQVPVNQMGQLQVNQMGQVPMNQPAAAQFNPMVPNGCMGQNPFLQQQNTPPQQMMRPPNPMKCAIQECDQVPFFDPIMGQQACCSFTHAMEHERRKALGSNFVKGVTHCLMPNCNRNVWPFMNYCGKTHAEAGKQLGLIPPDPNEGTPNQREVSEGVCALPGCKTPRFLEEGKEHPYCSKSHSEQGTDKGISLENVAKPEDRCAIPGCWKPKFIEAGVTHPFCSRTHRKKAEDMGSKLVVDPNAQCELPGCNLPKLIEKSGAQQDYCSKKHSEMDTPRRDAALLTDRKEVEKWLKTFPNLNVTDIKENPHALPGGALFKLYKEKYKSLAKNERKTSLAFHGTQEANIDSICQNGYNTALRSGQAHGPGEYFATTPDISFSYCRGGKKMLVNELLLGTPNKHHTQSGNIIVMKDPAHDLPRFVITFQ